MRDDSKQASFLIVYFFVFPQICVFWLLLKGGSIKYHTLLFSTAVLAQIIRIMAAELLNCVIVHAICY